MKIGKELETKESYRVKVEPIPPQQDPESCMGVGNSVNEALTEVRAQAGC